MRYPAFPNVLTMIELTLLGPLSLARGDGSSVQSVLAQPRRAAVLAYLATHRAPVPRGHLLALFWPESSDDGARNSLKQALHFLRRSLGEEAIVSSGHAVMIDHASLACDVIAFEEACDHGGWEEAFGLFRGDFLDGFYIGDAPDFERWVETERTRLRRRMIQVAWLAAEQLERDGKGEAACEWGRRAVSLSPEDEGQSRRLMNLLSRQGDRAGALEAYHRLVLLLREKYELEPTEEILALAADIRGTKPAIPEAVTVAPYSSERPDAPTLPRRDATLPPASPRTSYGMRTIAAASVAILAVAAGGWFTWEDRVAGSVSMPRQVVAVLPFADLGGAEEFLTHGIAEDVGSELATRPGLTVIGRASTAGFQDQATDLREIGRDLGAGTVVRGTVRMKGASIHVTAELVDVATERTLWSGIYDRTSANISSVQPEISAAIGSVLGAEPPATASRRLRHVDPDAHRLTLQARYRAGGSTQEDRERAVSLYQLAIQHDSAYAPAHAGLALTFFALADLSLISQDSALTVGLAESQRALELDSTLAAAHAAYGRALTMGNYWKEAERSYLKAIELEPSNAEAHAAYSTLLMFLGRGEDGVREMRRAAELEPLLLGHANSLGMYLYYTRRYAEAEQQLAGVLEVDPNMWVALGNLARVQLAQGKFAEAYGTLQKVLAIEPHPIPLATLVAYYVHMGQQEDAIRTLERIREWKGGIRTPRIAVAHVALGQLDSALVALERAEWDRGSIAALRWDPPLDPIRSDPRYHRILERFGVE